MKKLLLEPLTLFLLLGAAIFLFSGLGSDDTNDLIELSPANITRLSDQWQAQMGRPPTETELNGLVDQWLKEEIYYREAIKLGLDNNDTIIRRRLAQKLTFLTEDIATSQTPEQELLMAYYADNEPQYSEPKKYSFHHRYFSEQRRDNAQQEAAAAVANEAAQGDPFMLQKSFAARSEKQIGELFGNDFSKALITLAPGSWQGPIKSAYGWHAVIIEGVSPARVIPYPEVANKVLVDWQQQQRKLANEAFFQSTKEKYKIKR